MYDIVYDFIKNILFNTEANLYGIDTILTQVVMVLFFIALINLVVWCFNIMKSLIGW